MSENEYTWADLLEAEAEHETVEALKKVYKFYKQMIKAGFTEKQAAEILSAMMKGGGKK